MGSERGSGKSILAAQYDEDECFIYGLNIAVWKLFVLDRNTWNHITVTFTFGQIPLKKLGTCLSPHRYGLNSITTVLLQGWLWH